MKRQQTVLFLLLLCTAFALCGGDWRERRLAIYGLRPEYPVQVRGVDKVDSLQPELRWESFPRQEDLENDPELADHISDVTYDLRIWKKISYPYELIYRMEGLVHPYHTVQNSLEPSSEYIWAVRARFKLDGNIRVLDWGIAKDSAPTKMTYSDVVPNTHYYRLYTPSE